MDLTDARILLVGATGVLGRALAEALADAGARVVPAGRDAGRLADVAARCGTEPRTLDVVDLDSVTAAVDGAAADLGGLDALVVASGVAAFGPAAEADAAVVEEVFAVDVLGPMTLVRAALPHLGERGSVVVVSAILAELPTRSMAEYGAAKAALSHWLTVLRREARPHPVIDVRPPHMDTGLVDRALAGSPPRLPAGIPLADTVAAVLEAMRSDAAEVVWDAGGKRLAVR